jgi:hypothetical protein
MTPPVATEALLRHVKLPHKLWEPACGNGTGILDVLRAAGHDVIGSDLVDCGRPDCFARRDFGFRHDGLRPPAQTRGAWQYVHNGRIVVAVIELHSDDSRWHVIRNGKDVASYATRQDALASLRGAS